MFEVYQQKWSRMLTVTKRFNVWSKCKNKLLMTNWFFYSHILWQIRDWAFSSVFYKSHNNKYYACLVKLTLTVSHICNIPKDARLYILAFIAFKLLPVIITILSCVIQLDKVIINLDPEQKSLAEIYQTTIYRCNKWLSIR